jgi:hypothetical protein
VGPGGVVGAGLAELVKVGEHAVVARTGVGGPVASMRTNVSSQASGELVGSVDPLGCIFYARR